MVHGLYHKNSPNRTCFYPKVSFLTPKKATKIDKIFTVHLTLCGKRQINGEDLINFRGFPKKYEVYLRQAAPNFAYSFIMFEDETFKHTNLFQPTHLLET